ncbi:MAG: alginate export family protein [Cytophagaceae bacterium]|nr:alginate export family protein [Cytophagaceae bacterium]
MRKQLFSKLIPALFFAVITQSYGQFSLIGTVRTRTEMREGVGNLPLKGTGQAGFTSQRTNLLLGYKWDKLNFVTQLRDVRVWGQDASTISNNDGSKLFLHEAWGEITLATTSDTTCKLKIDNLSIKVGRQELVYDDVRLLGNLDWLQQGRRHDAALLKFLHRGYQADLGFAYNQNSDAFGRGNITYTPVNTNGYTASNGVVVTLPGNFVPNGYVPTSPPGTNAIGVMYKGMQFLYLSKKFKQTKISVLLFKDDFARSRPDTMTVTIGTNTSKIAGKRYDKHATYNRYTVGSNFSTTIGNASSGVKVALSGGFFYQGSQDKDGNTLDAYHFNALAQVQKGKFIAGPGIDYLSGNDGNSTSKVNNRFDPLYGTPHRYWGLMDYFYVGTGAPSTGLMNPHFKSKFTANKYSISADYHYFSAANDIKKPTVATDANVEDRYFGSEVDILLNFNINRFCAVESGYCMFFGTPSLEYVKQGSIDKTRKNAQFAYVMLTIRPDFFFTKPTPIKN